MVDLDRIAIVGGGLAGLRAAETLRRKGFEGWVGLISDEPHHPYDRPPLSKDVLTAPGESPSTEFRGVRELAAGGVDLMLGHRATGLNLAESQLEIGDEMLPYDGLILATGASARSLSCLDGLPDVYALRTRDDAEGVRAAFRRAHSIIVVGAGFIGGEVASSARHHGLEVTIVEAESAPLSRVLGSKLGAATVNLHESHGTVVKLGAAVTGGRGHPAGGLELDLSDGSGLRGDLVVVGVGVIPNTNWLQESGLALENGIVCDESLNAGHPNVFAAGDVVSWVNPLFGRRMRVEQWTNAAGQGRLAAQNLLDGTRRPFEGSNYFWSDMYGLRLQFAGIPVGEAQIVHGTVESDSFLAWFTEDGRVVGAFAIDAPEPFMVSKRLIEDRADVEAALDSLGLAAAKATTT